MSQRRAELVGRVIAVTFAAPPLLAAYARELDLADVPVCGDPDRAAYAAFGLERGSVARVWLDPRVWWRYARLIAAGRRFAGIGEDPRQLGGDAVLDAEGRLRWIHRSRGPADRPSVDALAAAMTTATDPPPPRSS